MLGPTEARFEIPEVGICGTDRKIAAFEHGAPPPGRDRLVLGHKALPKFVEIGHLVQRVEPRNLVVPAVRRPCSPVGAWHAGAAGPTSAARAITPSTDKEGDGFLSE